MSEVAWIRNNWPMIVSCVMVVGAWFQTGHRIDAAEYRISQLENSSKELNGKIDNLSNTIIGSIDLVRRDVNRLTTQVEVLSARVGMIAGDIDEPKQRRSRPPPQEPPD
jgi:outer membrane murein-binding lipoprotein Lpp